MLITILGKPYLVIWFCSKETASVPMTSQKYCTDLEFYKYQVACYINYKRGVMMIMMIIIINYYYYYYYYYYYHYYYYYYYYVTNKLSLQLLNLLES